MVIRKGTDWGSHGALAAHAPVAHTDGEARHLLMAAREEGRPLPEIGLLGGDLCATLGGPGELERLRTPAALRVPLDLGEVLLDGRLHYFVAHLVARRSWWRGPVYAAMNAQFLRHWDVAPRSHPNDGLLDCFEVRMPLGERLKAHKRLPSGAHLPHPGIRERRVAAVQWDVPDLDVWLDGERVARRVRHLSVRVEPDAWSAVL